MCEQGGVDAWKIVSADNMVSVFCMIEVPVSPHTKLIMSDSVGLANQKLEVTSNLRHAKAPTSKMRVSQRHQTDKLLLKQPLACIQASYQLTTSRNEGR